MARPYTYCNLLFNSKDELAYDVLKAFIKDNNILIPMFAIFWAPTLALTLTSILILVPPGIYTNINLQKTTK